MDLVVRVNKRVPSSRSSRAMFWLASCCGRNAQLTRSRGNGAALQRFDKDFYGSQIRHICKCIANKFVSLTYEFNKLNTSTAKCVHYLQFGTHQSQPIH